MLGNTDIAIAEPGDVIHIHSPGGGGRGSPLDREPERVRLDVERGYVSAAMAKARYGVVMADGSVDADATAALRAAMQERAHRTHFHFGPERDAFESVWHARNYDALTRLLSALPVHWRFFVKTKVFAAIRDGQNANDVPTAFTAVRRDYPQVPETLQAAE